MMYNDDVAESQYTGISNWNGNDEAFELALNVFWV